MKKGGKVRKRIPAMTWRWFLGNLLWIVILLAVADFGIGYFTRASYYSSAQQALEYRMSSIMNTVPSSLTPSGEANYQIRQLVQDYIEKEKFELMLLDNHGNVLLTSSGFEAQISRPPDYVSAMESGDGQGSFTGRSDQGENVAAITRLLNVPAGEIYAVRLVTSLSQVDARVGSIFAAVSVAVVLIILFAAFSSSYFLRSLVRPIQEIGQTAKDIASGNFNVRIEANYNDEIGELCDQINEMARGLSETERMKNEFISSVSHELRTPLTSVKGWAETLLSVGPEDRETNRKGLSIILSETGRLSNMVEDLLDFSRMQQNKGLYVKTERLDLVAELTEAVIIVDQRARRSGIEMKYDEPAETIPIEGDKGRIRQVFANIYDNAIKYSQGAGKITTTLVTDNEFATISIADEGAGIPKEDIPKLTTRFYKASNSTTGSGIGLSVVSEIMNLLGGRVEIESELGRGTTVKLFFPLLNPNKGIENEQ